MRLASRTALAFVLYRTLRAHVDGFVLTPPAFQTSPATRRPSVEQAPGSRIQACIGHARRSRRRAGSGGQHEPRASAARYRSAAEPILPTDPNDNGWSGACGLRCAPWNSVGWQRPDGQNDRPGRIGAAVPRLNDSEAPDHSRRGRGASNDPNTARQRVVRHRAIPSHRVHAHRVIRAREAGRSRRERPGRYFPPAPI